MSNRITAQKMTTIVREIEQRLPPKRRKPSMPTVSMLEDRPSGSRESAALAKVRLREQANPKPVPIPERRDVMEVQTKYVGAGANRSTAPEKRALTRVERLHTDGMIAYEEFQAANALRQRFMKELGGSEGVGSYDPSSRPSPGWEKADRKAVRILNRNRSNRSQLADLMFAMAGVYDTEGRKIFDQQLAVYIVRASIETVDGVTATQIGTARTAYTGIKQLPAAGGTILREALRRGAAHLGYARLPAWDDHTSWRVLDITTAAK